jgi:hypothetical protein
VSDNVEPAVDDRVVDVGVGIDSAWAALVATLDRALTRRTGAAALTRTRHVAKAQESAGLEVVAASPPVELVLEGRRRRGTYALVLRLDEVEPGRTVLWAECRAPFPDAAEVVQRLLAVSSGGQVSGVRSLLQAVRTQAEGLR